MPVGSMSAPHVCPMGVKLQLSATQGMPPEKELAHFGRELVVVEVKVVELVVVFDKVLVLEDVKDVVDDVVELCVTVVTDAVADVVVLLRVVVEVPVVSVVENVVELVVCVPVARHTSPQSSPQYVTSNLSSQAEVQYSTQ